MTLLTSFITFANLNHLPASGSQILDKAVVSPLHDHLGAPARFSFMFNQKTFTSEPFLPASGVPQGLVLGAFCWLSISFLKTQFHCYVDATQLYLCTCLFSLSMTTPQFLHVWTTRGRQASLLMNLRQRKCLCTPISFRTEKKSELRK